MIRIYESEAMSMLMNTAEYLSIIENIKSEITAAQYVSAQCQCG